MDRNLVLLLAAAGLIGITIGGRPPAARADRLGGNYRGPDDVYQVHEDPPPPPPGAPGAGGAPAGDGSGGDAGSAGGKDAETPPDSKSGEGSEEPPPPKNGGDYRGPAGEKPDDSRQPEDPPPPDSGGSTPPPPDEGDGGSDGTGDGASGGGNPTPGGAGGAGTTKGGKKSPDDRDRIWPFYFEGAKEEYLAAALGRRGEARISPPGSSTWALSPLPAPRQDRRPFGETERNAAFDLVMERLRDPDSHVRDAAVIAAGKSGRAGAIPSLLRIATYDRDPAVREDALLALGLSGRRREVLPYLLEALQAPRKEGRGNPHAFAALGLGLLGDREGAAEPLRALYESAAFRPDRGDEAAAAATALGMLGDPGAIPLFARALASRTCPAAVRSFTLHALGKFGAHPDAGLRGEAFALVRSALEARGGRRAAALLALGGFPGPEAAALLADEGLVDPDPACRIYAAHALGRVAGRAGPGSREFALAEERLSRVAEKDRRDRWLFQAGNLALAGASAPGREKRLLELAAEERELNLHSASSVVLSLGLEGTGSPEAAERLRLSYGNRSSGSAVQAYAGLGLGLSDAPGAAEALSRLLRSDVPPNASVARASALALGLVGGAEESDLLVAVLRGEAGATGEGADRFFVLGAAVQALGLIADGGAVDRLRPLLDPAMRWERRAFATAALGYLLEPDPAHRVAPRLSEIFRHHDYLVPLPVVRAVQSTL